MDVALVIGLAALLLVASAFVVLQWASGRTYRPTPEQVKELLVATIEGRIGLNAFDEFSSVRIAYDRRLDRIREKYNQIVDNRSYIDGAVTNEGAVPLNEDGKDRLRELVHEVEQIATQQVA